MSEQVPIPEEVPRLLPIRSAMSWWRVIAGATLVAFVMVLLMAFGAFAAPDALRPIIMTGAFLGGLAAACTLLVASVRGYQAERAERAAGYTTVYGRGYEYWQLDPKIGRVIRRPGDHSGA